MNIAIISPSTNAYSETFIRAHKERLRGNIFFYYGTPEEFYLENHGSINYNLKKILYKAKRKLYSNNYKWFYERLFIDSFKKNKIDVVLAEFGDVAHKFINPIRELKLPLIVHFHGRDATVNNIIEKSNNYMQVFKTANYVIAVSNKMYNDLLALGCPEEKLVYNVYGPDEEFFSVRPEFSKFQFISIGRFVDKKAPYYLILSFLKVLEQFPDTKLLMAGEGPLKETCENLVQYYNLENSIKFLGIITPENYRKYLSESIALVQHSIQAKNGDCEGTPLAILEANAAGIPVISTLHGGIPDVVIEAETGYLVEEHDVIGMAQKMIETLKNVPKAKVLGDMGRKNISNNFTLERHIRVLDELISKVYNLERSE
ncbi:glycosyltransferase family 4 protein [Salegentibacter salegens]|uniref:Glycosyltransferase involved in cell wall bisynthesis n=1 Tax=Salegentibacter salegens TaxID=143223 RepID=A0A1M7NDU4_9FLAO|nr:glycosyltransferase family 4 protein [Salegentibacter salegens]PRX41538.1 glycosyltransferase involved in cell wall biosynthesis [Salegentibacter salegens]SHN01895.1 Glycosyltransferase involved in cell wall bisynthesis [Salegentibacter salegens]